MDPSIEAIRQEILATLSGLRAGLAAVEKQIDTAMQRLQGLSDKPSPAKPVAAAPSSSPLSGPETASVPGESDFVEASDQVLGCLPQTETQPDKVLELLQRCLKALRTSRQANELLNHLEAARRAGPPPPHPFYERLAELETKAMEEGIRLAERLDDALDFADTFWKHYNQPSKTEKAYLRAVEIARDVQECLQVARQARLRYEEVGIKEPGQVKPSSFRRRAPFGDVAQRALVKARSLCRSLADRQGVDQEVKSIERDFQQLNLQSNISLW